jgi:membrane-associated protease RseP (regulator of RpoE activity)
MSQPHVAAVGAWESAAEALGAEIVDELAAPAAVAPVRRRRRVWLPAMLLLATGLSTFWVGANQWYPLVTLWLDPSPAASVVSRQMALVHWQDGLIYMLCVLGILLAHEMGHFVATLIYRIPASLPFVIPMPLLPIGTFGAVIAMDGRRADRKQTFDIGIAGPLAGLVIAIPVIIWGTLQLDFTQPAYGPFALRNPLFIQFLLDWLQPTGYERGMPVAMSQLNPYFMAGWVGLLVTGLNMLPVSQLDGGHVIYTLFGKPAHWIARGFMVLAVGYLAYSIYMNGEAQWVLMIGLILFVGIDHPPTRDDNVPIGWFRYALGLASLAIPILCFSPRALSSLVM